MKKIWNLIVITLFLSIGLFLLVISFINYDSLEDKFPFNLGIDEYALRAIFGVLGFIMLLLVAFSGPISHAIKNYFKKRKKKSFNWSDWENDKLPGWETQELYVQGDDCDCGQYSHQTTINLHGIDNTKVRRFRRIPTKAERFFGRIFTNIFCGFVVGILYVACFFDGVRDFLKKKANLLRIGIVLSAGLFFLFMILSAEHSGTQKGETLFWFGMASLAFFGIIFAWVIHRILTSRRGLKEFRTFLFILVIFAFAANVNAQNPSETEYMREMILKSFHYESHFFDPVTNTTFHSESYKVKDQGIQVRFTTIVEEKSKDNRFWVGIFDEFDGNYPEPLYETMLSFDGLAESFNKMERKGIFRIYFGDDFWIHLPIGNNEDKPGEFLIITGNIFNELGESKGTFDIAYHVENLLLNKGISFWQGYPEPIEYQDSKAYSFDLELIKIANNSLNY